MTPVSCLAILGAVSLLSSCGSAAPAGVKPGAPTAGALAGQWRMIGEEAADPEQPVLGQGRRLLRLGADGSYHADSYLEAIDGRYEVDGDRLTVTGGAAPQTITIEAAGNPRKLEAMLQLLEPFGIREFVRSGTISLSRGATALGDSGRARMRRVI